LFFEPFYQFMRQQYLANEMEKVGELEANIVSLLHIAPNHNHDFKRITSPQLRTLAETATRVWSRIVRKKDRFTSVSTEALFGRFDVTRYPELRGWKDYITARYSWVAR
jgi:hypothetical protein